MAAVANVLRSRGVGPLGRVLQRQNPPVISQLDPCLTAHGGNCIHIPGFLSDDGLMQALAADIEASAELGPHRSGKHLVAYGEVLKGSRPFKTLIAQVLSTFELTLVDCWVNLYRNGGDLKSWHHDNYQDRSPRPTATIGMSLGDTRDLAFQHMKTGQEFRVTQRHGDLFAFDDVFNRLFKHSVPPAPERTRPALRISVIVWANEEASVPTVVRRNTGFNGGLVSEISWQDWSSDILAAAAADGRCSRNETQNDSEEALGDTALCGNGAKPCPAPPSPLELSAASEAISAVAATATARRKRETALEGHKEPGIACVDRRGGGNPHGLASTRPVVGAAEHGHVGRGSYRAQGGYCSYYPTTRRDVSDTGQGGHQKQSWYNMLASGEPASSPQGIEISGNTCSGKDAVDRVKVDGAGAAFETENTEEGDKGPADVTHALTLQGALQVLSILRGYKLVENRSWKIPRGWYAIHAGAQIITEERLERVMQVWPEAPKEDSLPHGAILGLFFVHEHRSVDECKPGYVWARGPICHVVSKAIELPTPIRCGGGRALWPLTEPQRRRIREQLCDAEPTVFDLSVAI
eukprot:TRINITY_DN13433_c0_g2_i1.p1 TRINITY_DN13433_c0_g2~~TRINITY_DN13433_c0_g2_i1.p1  ORF type:complete len:579 (+),score=81.02 TRINITY_DN13433_c0_g2_i1:89-1825(+)